MDSNLELLGLKEASQHLDEITKHHRTPHIIGEIQAIGGFPAKRLCIGDILMVAVFELSDHDVHAVCSIFLLVELQKVGYYGIMGRCRSKDQDGYYF
jgi:hypothetical protein